MESPPDSVAGEGLASIAGDDTQSEPAASPKCLPSKRKRLLRELADHNSAGGKREEDAAVLVSPSPADSVSIATSSESGEATTRRSPRATVPVKRLCDFTDGRSESEEKGSSSKREAHQRHEYRPAATVVKEGARFCKKFEVSGELQDKYFWGTVGKEVKMPVVGTSMWHVHYDDNDEEVLEKGDVLKLIQFEQARKQLSFKMGVSIPEVLAALEQMDPPYGLNAAMKLIHIAKQQPNATPAEEFKRFKPAIGLKIRKNFSGTSWNASVVAGPKPLEVDGQKIKVWEVVYDDDGDIDDMEYHELFRWRANRPDRPHASMGRQMCALELFSGLGIVSQAFADRRFRVQSIDNDHKSNATMLVDIMKLRYEDIGMVPDFLWISLPCHTYSRLPGTIHRDLKADKLEKTAEAHFHNRILLQVKCIIEWVQKKHPHLIVVIENPEANLRKMPLMKEIETRLGLKKTTVHYCAVGATEKKPTNLWSNVSQVFIAPICE